MTFRSHAPADVIRFAADARLKAIEWGGDVHVPAGDFVCAKEVKDRTVDAGLAVASYGSYLRLGSSPRSEQEAVVETAVALGAPRIRVWAGTRGSEDAGAHHWAAVVRDAREFADTAASADVLVGLEFHGGTLTDRAESTAALLSEIERDSRLGTYWQPPQGMPDSEALRGLDLLAGNVLAVHAFSWWPTDERRPLADRSDLWRAVLERMRGQDSLNDVLFEFVLGDSATQLARDAGTLRRLIEEASREAHPEPPDIAAARQPASY
ncbi:sugar phosphate isomerase/epimerase family protein [Arthrobacter sp. MMS24-S77]